MRVPTLSRMDCVELEVSPLRACRLERSAASEASSRGAALNSCPGRSSANPSIHTTEETSVATCQKQAKSPTQKTKAMKPLR